MKKIIFILLVFLSTNTFAVEKSSTFTMEVFKKAQAEGKVVVINSWNKTCFTCKKQTQILEKAKKNFDKVLFLSFEQTKDKDIANFLGIDYWTTIVIYKHNKEIYRSLGEVNKAKIFSAIDNI